MYLGFVPVAASKRCVIAADSSIAGKKRGAVAVIELRQHQVIGEERGDKDHEYRRPVRAEMGKPRRSNAAGANITIKRPRNSQSG